MARRIYYTLSITAQQKEAPATLKPKSLRPGDIVALVSLSSGMAGDAPFAHTEFHLKVAVMPNAMKGSAFLDQNPQACAADLMQAFADPGIKAVICMVGGDDTIRLLPYGALAEIDCAQKTFRLLEPGTQPG